MNDEQLIWEAYTTMDQVRNAIWRKKTKPVELTEEELINVITQEGGFKSTKPAETILKYWEDTDCIYPYNKPKPVDRSVIEKNMQGKYLFDRRNYDAYISWSMIHNAVIASEYHNKRQEQFKRQMEELQAKEQRFPQTFKHLNAEELGPDDEPNPQILYHAGPTILKVEDIEFDRGALGFHLGTEQQIEYISKGTYKKDSGLSHRQMERGGRLKISKFLVSPHCPNGKYITIIESDMPWEDPVQLAIYLNYSGILNRVDVERALDVFGYQDNREDGEDIDDNDLGSLYYSVLDKIHRFGYYSSNYHPADDLPVVHPYNEYFKDKQALAFVRNLLVEQGFAGIIYENVGEGMHVADSGEDQYSLCVLDKCILKDVVPVKPKAKRVKKN